MADIVIHTDGASRGNPGAAAIAYVINRAGEKLIKHAETIGTTTNNQAEYQALLAALAKLAELTPSASMIECFSDSELMVKQLNGEYKMKNAELRPHFAAIQTLAEQLRRANNKLTFIAVRRHENKLADQLCNQALDGTL